MSQLWVSWSKWGWNEEPLSVALYKAFIRLFYTFFYRAAFVLFAFLLRDIHTHFHRSTKAVQQHPCFHLLQQATLRTHATNTAVACQNNKNNAFRNEVSNFKVTITWFHHFVTELQLFHDRFVLAYSTFPGTLLEDNDPALHRCLFNLLCLFVLFCYDTSQLR